MSVQLAYQSFVEQFDKSEVAIVKDSLGNLWIRATVACEKLEFSDAHRTVTTYCKPHQYQQFKVGNGRPALYVNESGFYRMTLKSKSIAAEEFIDWLTEDVLPKLRADGGYIMPTATSEQVEVLEAPTFEALHKLAMSNFVKFRQLCRIIFEFEHNYRLLESSKIQRGQPMTKADVASLFYHSR